ncbi:unnamed protein product [Rhizophagus irregularis]|nr:unnamed protein product [Rhizophagus irregularis]
MEKQIPQYVKGAESFSQLKQLYGKALRALSVGWNYVFRFKNLGLVDAIKTFDSTKIEQAVFRNIEKLTSKAVYNSVTDKVANALRYGLKLEEDQNDNSRDGIAAGVEGVPAVEAAIIGITEEEAASVLAACAIWKDDDLLSIIIYSIISTIILTS